MNINFQNIQDELQSYLEFKPGWDGYRAEPFQKDLVERVQFALNLANELCQSNKCPDSIIIGPAPDGSIDIEIKRGDKVIMLVFYPGISVEINGSKKEGWCTSRWENTIELDWNVIEAELRWVLIPYSNKMMSLEEAQRLRKEGEEMRKEIECRVAPMKQV